MKNPSFEPCALARLLRETVFPAIGLKQGSANEYPSGESRVATEIWSNGRLILSLSYTDSWRVTVTTEGE